MSKGRSGTVSLVIRYVVVTVLMIAALKLSMPHRSLVRESIVAVVAMGAGLAYSLSRRRRTETGAS